MPYSKSKYFRCDKEVETGNKSPTGCDLYKVPQNIPPLDFHPDNFEQFKISRHSLWITRGDSKEQYNMAQFLFILIKLSSHRYIMQ